MEPILRLRDLLVVMVCSDTIITVVKKAALALLVQLVEISGCEVGRLGDQLIDAYRGAQMPRELWGEITRLEEIGCLKKEDLVVLGVGKAQQ